MPEQNNEPARISHLIDDINYDYVQHAYWIRQWEMSVDIDEIDPKKALLSAVLSLGALHRHTKELLDLLYPHIQNWS